MVAQILDKFQVCPPEEAHKNCKRRWAQQAILPRWLRKGKGDRQREESTKEAEKRSTGIVRRRVGGADHREPEDPTKHMDQIDPADLTDPTHIQTNVRGHYRAACRWRNSQLSSRFIINPLTPDPLAFSDDQLGEEKGKLFEMWSWPSKTHLSLWASGQEVVP